MARAFDGYYDPPEEPETTWQMDDVITMPMHVDCNVPMQYVLWQADDEGNWQVRRVYALAGDLQTTNFAGYFSADELANATKIGRWDDKARRVLLTADELPDYDDPIDAGMPIVAQQAEYEALVNIDEEVQE